MHWSTGYIGLPWKHRGRNVDGVDCWGIVHLVYAEQLRIAVASYVGEPGAIETQEIKDALRGDDDAWPWIEVTDTSEFDLVTFTRGTFEEHVGVIVEPGKFLHVADGITSRIERYNSERWRAMVGRFLRHQDRKDC